MDSVLATYGTIAIPTEKAIITMVTLPSNHPSYAATLMKKKLFILTYPSPATDRISHVARFFHSQGVALKGGGGGGAHDAS